MIPEHYLALNIENGLKIEEIKDMDVIFTTQSESFVKDFYFESRSKDLEHINWSFEIGNKQLRLKPLFTENIIFFRTGQSMGSIYAINRKTGQTLWQTESNIISNIIHSNVDDKIIALSRDGKLISFDAQSGEEKIWVEFSQIPFIVNGEQSIVVGGYELAYDDKTKTIYVLLGDSRQLFAFKEK